MQEDNLRIKVLTIGALDYCALYGKNIKRYNAVPVEIELWEEKYDHARELFLRNLPLGTEVVVAYVPNLFLHTEVVHRYSGLIQGTALVPKVQEIIKVEDYKNGR